jgi:hypothetical protein
VQLNCFNSYDFNFGAVTTIAVLMLAVIVSGCNDGETNFSQEESNAQSPLVMVIKDQAEDHSREVSVQVQKSLDYSKIPFLSIDLGIISQGFKIPKSVRSIVVTTESVGELSIDEIEDLVEFTAKGNSIVFTGPVSIEKLAYLQGIKYDASYASDSTSTGFILHEEAFPGMEGEKYQISGMMAHYGLTGDNFNDNVKVLAGTASELNTPFIVSHSIGLGEVVTINSYAITEKIYRGIIFSAMLRGLQGIPYQVADVSTLFLDDFPAPLYNEKLPPIDEEYDVTHAEFVSSIWWPDIKALADSFNISYSAMTAFNYNANVVPPFDFQEWREGSILYNQEIIQGSIYLADDIRNSRHELAFHGYNHFSLWEEDWDNINFMISALQAARKRWRVDNMGPLPTNYVPPTNQIDSLGLEALIRGMPSIQYMSSLYFGEIEDGGGREFDPDPYVPSEIFNYPRISSGFTMNSNSLFEQQGLQLLTGVWNHFIHPDDVFQVIQRQDDDFTSRNPLGLGWKSTPGGNYGLYHLLSRRIKFTNKYFPINRFVTATNGARRAEDWRRSLSNYSLENASIKVESQFRPNYTPNFDDNERHWFMYVKNGQYRETENLLNKQDIDFTRSTLWNGYLYQIRSSKQIFVVPNFDKPVYHSEEFLNKIAMDHIAEFQQFNIPPAPIVLSTEEWRDARMEEALNRWRSDPESIARQDTLIKLSIEFDQTERAISILEDRLLDNENWDQHDQDRLIQYYGWEGMQARAEEFLEILWDKYASAQVIAFKEQATAALGLFGTEYERRWSKRELQLNPDDYQQLLSYTKSLESSETWPEMKRNLLRLLEMNPDTDSLYAFTVERSIYYESQDSTIALVEQFPAESYNQLTPFASNLALMYGFTEGDLEQALFWANNAPEFDQQLILFWLGELELDQLYLAKSDELLSQNPSDDGLRSYVGTNLFYRGFTDKSYQVLYPLFENGEEEGFTADTLVRNEISYLGYSQKKEFFIEYPAFFDEDQEQELRNTHRKNEGTKVSVNGEYRDDNFDNTFARGGVSVQFGNRLKSTHSLKTEYLIFSDEEIHSGSALDYQGLGYEFSRRSDNQQLEYRLGANALFGENNFIPEALISVGYSYDSTYTSAQLTGGAELTSTALANDYYQAELQMYRQDYWVNGNLSTALSANVKYYTNDVLRYGGQGRLYLELMETKWRIRPIGELAYSDATENFTSGVPYYTPDQYFSQGIGADIQYRNPDSFDYKTRLIGELMGKHERRDGYYLTGRLELEHTFDNFWSLRIGSEISTSSVYRSNRIFFTISHSFPRKLIPNK